VNEFEYIPVLLSILIGLGIPRCFRVVEGGAGRARARAGRWLLPTVGTPPVASFQVWWISSPGARCRNDVLPACRVRGAARAAVPAGLPDRARRPLSRREALARASPKKSRPFYVIVALIPQATFLQQCSRTPHRARTSTADGACSRRCGFQVGVAVASFALLPVYISLPPAS
jgi:hypothetical protein